MRTNLVWITPNAQERIIYMARVSNPSGQASEAGAERLVRYLIAHNHWSPFEMASACFEIETTRDIARQILRHRSFSFQEFSQRYAETDALPEAEPREARLQDRKNRQNSLASADEELHDWWVGAQLHHQATSQELYEEAIAKGLAKEVARAVLPEGLTTSRMYMAGTLRSWRHYVDVRATPETQKEHREIAQAIKVRLNDEVPALFPLTSEEMAHA